jgi:hypothetical protein
MQFLLTAAIFFLFSFRVSSQNIDTSRNSIDSPAKQIQTPNEALEDSLYRLKMERSVNEKGKELDKFLADYKEYKEKEQRQIYIRIGVGVVFVAALIYGVARKKRMKNNNR